MIRLIAAIPIIATDETAAAAVAQEVTNDLQQLKPNVLLETIKSWIPGLIHLGYKLLAVAVILFIGSRVISALMKIIDRSFKRMEIEVSLERFLLSFIRVIFYGILIFIAAEKLGISSASIIAILGSAGLAVGLALQGSLKNFAGGILILLMKPFRVGDYIISSGGEGTVAVIGLVYTTLKTVDNKKVVIPNSVLSDSSLTNLTAWDKRRLIITVGIGYQSDIKKAKDILQRLFEEHPMTMKDEPIEVYVDQLADSCVVLGGRAWTGVDDYWTVKWEITEQLKLAYDKAGIEIPYQQLDVNVKN